MSELSFRGS